MPDRSRQLDVAAIVMAAATLFLAFALGTYHRCDPPSTLCWPQAETIRNACGWSGAHTAHAMLEAVGVGAYYALGSLAVLTTLLLARRGVDQPLVRGVGWVMSLVGLTTLAALALPEWSPGPVVGAGGYLGASGRAWLNANFATVGSYILTLSVLLAGVLLSTDYLVFRWAAAATTASGAGLTKVGALGQAAALRVRRSRTDLETVSEELSALTGDAAEAPQEGAGGEWEEEEEEEGPGLRVRTRAAKEPAPVEDEADSEQGAEEDEEEYEYEEEAAGEGEEEEEDAEGAPTTVASIRDKLSSVLGGKRRGKASASPPEPLPVKKPKSEREEILDQLDAAEAEAELPPDYELPPIDLLLPSEQVSYEAHEEEVRNKARIIERTFKEFGFNVKVVEVETGPVIAQYEIKLEAGLRLSKIMGLADDLAIALRVPSVRIVAPIPGKNTVGIEAPNETRQLVRLREVIEETDGRAKRMKIPIFLGKDVAGNPMAVDLAALPHLLIAGRTGTGKSVCLNSIIVSILMTRGPDEVRMLMIDPKMVELSGYRKLPHLMHPVVTDMKKAEAILAWAVDKMEERYALLARAGVRHVSVYNQLSEAELRDRIQPEDEDEWARIPRQLPFIVIVADEMADLMMTSGKEVEHHIIRLAQKSRAVGIHLILATQKPTVDVITGLIKSNLPARIAFQVASRTDSRVVLDEMGADKLLGNGDMLFLSPGTSQLLRGQGTYLSDDEITRVVDSIGTDQQQFATELMQLKTKEEQEAAATPGGLKNRDELYEAAVDVVVREGRGSVSLLQRCLGIGYGRAARLIDFMAEDGIVGQYNGSQAREVTISVEEWEAMTSGAAAGEPAPAPAKPTAKRAPEAPWESGVGAEDDEAAELEEEDAEEVGYEEGDDEQEDEEVDYEDGEVGEEEYEEDADEEGEWEDEEASEEDEWEEDGSEAEEAEEELVDELDEEDDSNRGGGGRRAESA